MYITCHNYYRLGNPGEKMPVYHHENRYNRSTSYHQHARFVRRVKWLVFFISFVIISGISVFAAAVFLQSQQSQQQAPATSNPRTSTVTPSVNILRSNYFQFQAPRTWVEVAGETTPTKFVYRSFQAQLVKQDLTIYVNSSKSNTNITRVLPVNILANGRLTPDKISNHCSSALPPATVARKDPAGVSLYGITFTCTPDSVAYTVAIGQKQKGTVLTLKRPDGTNATYEIIYRNVMAVPDTQDLLSIIENFETR